MIASSFVLAVLLYRTSSMVDRCRIGTVSLEVPLSRARSRSRRRLLSIPDARDYSSFLSPVCRYNSGFFFRHPLLQKYRYVVVVISPRCCGMRVATSSLSLEEPRSRAAHAFSFLLLPILPLFELPRTADITGALNPGLTKSSFSPSRRRCDQRADLPSPSLLPPPSRLLFPSLFYGRLFPLPRHPRPPSVHPFIHPQPSVKFFCDLRTSTSSLSYASTFRVSSSLRAFRPLAGSPSFLVFQTMTPSS